MRDRRVLMVRSRGRDVLYLPGGKIEPGETAVDAVVRESLEETGLHVDPAGVDAFGTVVTAAHDQPPGTVVEMALFLVRPGGPLDSATPVASSEVDAVEWVTTADAARCPPAGVETLRLLTQAERID